LKLEYVASGMSFVRLNDGRLLNANNKDIFTKMQNWVDKIVEKHRFGMLYNAFQEADFPNVLSNFNVPLYADSGGLQMMTKGVEINGENKAKVFEAQLKAKYAFCLDEVPIERIAKKKRIVIKDGFFDKGVETGKNIKEQIDYFRKHNAETKVFVIVQGQELEDYRNYINGILTQISEEDYPFIAGFAISVACSGSSIYSALKAIMASFELQKLDLPDRIKQRIHYLGFGSTKKFLLIKELSSKFYPQLDISADSISATMTYYMSATYINKESKMITFRRYSEEYLKEVKDPVIEAIFNDLSDFVKRHNLDLTEEEFKMIKYVFIKGTFVKRSDLDEKERKYYSLMLLLLLLAQIDNIMENVENRDLKWLENQDKVPYTMLLKANNVQELDEIVNKIIKKPKDIFPRLCSNTHRKHNAFKDLF